MAYQSNKPQVSDYIDQSATDIQQNFSEIETLISVDHETFGAADGKQGHHKKVLLTKQTSDPTTDANSVALYCKSNGTDNTLHLKKSDGSVVDLFSGSYTQNDSNPSNTFGHTVLPSGIIMNWGKFKMAASGGGSQSLGVSLSKAYTTGLFSLTYGVDPQNSSTTDIKNSLIKYTYTTGSTSISFRRYASRDEIYVQYIAIGI